jgi:hypothetical protein
MERTIVNFTVADSGTGTLARAVPRVDPNTEGTHQWDIDAVFFVDEVQAAHVDGALPQASEYLARARDKKGSATITIKPAQRDVRLSLTTTTTDDPQLVLGDVAAEIRHIKLAVTEKAQAYTARLRLYGLTPDQGAGLLACLGQPVEFQVQPAQLSLDLGDSAPLGAVVSGSDGANDVFGVLQQRRGEQYIVDDFGVLHTVGAINAALDLGDIDLGVADRYAQQVRDAGGAPSWRALVAAMGATGLHTLDDEVMLAAVAMHLPPEPGVMNG